MNLTEKILAKLDEQIRYLRRDINIYPSELQKERLSVYVALRRQVEKHIDSYTGAACDCCEGTWDCNVCSEYYPCTFIKEVATDLGIEVEQ